MIKAFIQDIYVAKHFSKFVISSNICEHIQYSPRTRDYNRAKMFLTFYKVTAAFRHARPGLSQHVEMTKADGNKNQLRRVSAMHALSVGRNDLAVSFRNDDDQARSNVQFQVDNNRATHSGREFHSVARVALFKAESAHKSRGLSYFLPRCVSLAWIRVDTRTPGKLFYEGPVRSQISAAFAAIVYAMFTSARLITNLHRFLLSLLLLFFLILRAFFF